MKINKLNTIKLKVPLNKPMRTRYFTLDNVFCLLVCIKSETGLEGQGLIRAASLADINIVENIVHTIFAPQLIGTVLISPEQTWDTLWLHKRNHLQSSFALYALAAIDIAIWDLKAHSENKSLSKLLNIKLDFVIPYGNGGWLTDSNKLLFDVVKWYLDHGCNHFKMRVGSNNDISRIKFLRDTFAFEINLSVDANQYYDFDEAVEMSKVLADFNVSWFEEPLFSNSITELGKLAELSPIPIATGENMNSHWQIQDACSLKAAEIFQPDVIYQGGITEFKRTAAIINSAKLSLGTHLFHELSCSIAGLGEKHYVEHIDFFPKDLFIHHFEIKDGKIFLPKTSGHSATVSKQAIQKYQLT